MLFVFSLGAVRRNVALSNVTDSDIQREIVRCLHGALDRDGGRRACMKRQAAAAAPPSAATSLTSTSVQSNQSADDTDIESDAQ